MARDTQCVPERAAMVENLIEPMRDPTPVFWDRKAYRSASWRLWGKLSAIGSSPAVLVRGTTWTGRFCIFGQGQTISQPFIVALMTHFCRQVRRNGPGSWHGIRFQAAVLARLVRKVCTVRGTTIGRKRRERGGESSAMTM